MDRQKGPTGFIVVLPGEIIEIPQRQIMVNPVLQPTEGTCGKVEVCL